MTAYQGPSLADPITGGGAYVDAHGYGHEVYNFLPYRGRMYGYVQGHRFRIALEQMGEGGLSDVGHGITVVWIATKPVHGGQYVIGWYKNASVHRALQDPPSGFDRTVGNEVASWNISADATDAVLLPPDARDFRIRSRGAGTISQANVYYLKYSPEERDWRPQFLEYLEQPNRIRRSRKRRGRRAPERALIERIESASVQAVSEQYSAWGFDVKSVERENLGWDLEAEHPDRSALRIEVKGTKSGDVRSELTPNEFRAFQRTRDYRLCIVTDALGTNPAIHTFLQGRGEGWGDDDGCVLDIEPIIGARVYASKGK